MDNFCQGIKFYVMVSLNIFIWQCLRPLYIYIAACAVCITVVIIVLFDLFSLLASGRKSTLERFGARTLGQRRRKSCGGEITLTDLFHIPGRR